MTAACVAMATTGWAASPAGAAFPGENGKIAFFRSGDIYVVNPDGSGATSLTADMGATEDEPAWSPDGERIAFRGPSLASSFGEIWVMDADGSGKTRLTNNSEHDARPTWSPDGQRIVFGSSRIADGEGEIYVMNADGSAQTNLTNNSAPDTDPAWSPDGDRIAFSSHHNGNWAIFVMNADGSGQTRLTDEGLLEERFPTWSPDGQKIAFNSYRAGSNPEIWVMNADGSNPTRLTNNPANDYRAAWSPNGQKIAFDSNRNNGETEVYTMNADGSGPAPVSNVSATEYGPDWQPLPPAPIVFVHGFAGSIIECSGDQLYPDVPVKFPEMRLQADGETNNQEGACNPLAQPTEILDSFLTTDVYGPAVAFLDQIAPDNNYIYVWDWRKDPGLALDELDLMVEEARCGGTLPVGQIICADPTYPKVALMGHSMGGLVIRDYINDQPRANKVARALTVGTPYWGSPKAIFPLAAGLELPTAEGLDSIIVDSEFHEWARNAQGLYFLYPSASFGGWLTVEGREPRPLDRPGLLDFVSELGGTEALLGHALDSHASELDGFDTNGVDYQAFVGAGLATIERVLLFEAGGQDYVKLRYAQGDGTVPVRSAAQGPQGTADPLGENIPIHYSCGIGHVPLPGEPAVTARITDFLVGGSPIVPGPTSCASSGFQIEIYELDLAPQAALSAADQGPMVRSLEAAAEPMTLEEAELAGLISLLDLGAQKVIVTDSATPVELTYSSDQFELNATPLTNANLGPTSFYGPLSGEVTIAAGAGLGLADTGGPVAPRSDGAPALSIADASAPEGAAAGFQIALSRPAAFPVAVDYATENASATAGSDYTAATGTLVFEPGQTSKLVSVLTAANSPAEGNESFRVRLSNPLDAAIADGEGVGTIMDASPPAAIQKKCKKGRKLKKGKCVKKKRKRRKKRK